MTGTRDGVVLWLLAAVAGCFFVVMLSFLIADPGAPRPVPTWPREGEQIETLTPTLRWEGVKGATQVEFWMVADGPAAAIRVTAPERERFTVPNPDQWCCMREGLRYRWKVRATDSSIPLGPEDPWWGEWSVEHSFTVRKAQ